MLDVGYWGHVGVRISKNLGTCFPKLTVSLFMISLTLTLSAPVHVSRGDPDYTYYGVVPSKIYR